MEIICTDASILRTAQTWACFLATIPFKPLTTFLQRSKPLLMLSNQNLYLSEVAWQTCQLRRAEP